MNDIPIVPGRGITSTSATRLRLDYIESLHLEAEKIADTTLDPLDVVNNIESFIGSVEVPLGLVGPLLFRENGSAELVYTAAGTLEGALIYSMNRGAKLLSRSGGVSAEVLYQRMLRAPMLVFNTPREARLFEDFFYPLETSFMEAAESWSNHAKVLSCQLLTDENCVHLKVYYATGDASGQNMTTTCTWHALTDLMRKFRQMHPEVQVEFVIEGNAASDKKVSLDSIQMGRGIKVVASANIPEQLIHEVLRTTSEKFLTFFDPARRFAEKQGMIGFNINVTNAIASIFVATGQDLASIHESGTGFLDIQPSSTGLACTLTLTNLVVGTIGGGTHLPKQQEVLHLMGCSGQGKVERFAKLIASFALGLELSTFAAIVSGEFAKSHEKLGRNRPVKWLVKADIDRALIQQGMSGKFPELQIDSISLFQSQELDIGILTNLTQRISNKLIGFIPVRLTYQIDYQGPVEVIIRSKALDTDLIKGLHLLASSIDTELADLIFSSKDALEYRNSHLKDIQLNQYLDSIKYPYFPAFYGSVRDEHREIYLIFQEFLNKQDFRLRNTENQPEVWTAEEIKLCIKAITVFHQQADPEQLSAVKSFQPWKAKSLYIKLLQILIQEKKTDFPPDVLHYLLDVLDSLEDNSKEIQVSKTLIHHDFNPRNLMFRRSGEPVIYDWELAVIDFPQRDIVELLSFVLKPDFRPEELNRFLAYHHSFYPVYSIEEWRKACLYSMQVYLITRISFYEVSAILANYDFSARVLQTSLKMLDLLRNS